MELILILWASIFKNILLNHTNINYVDLIKGILIYVLLCCILIYRLWIFTMICYIYVVGCINIWIINFVGIITNIYIICSIVLTENIIIDTVTIIIFGSTEFIIYSLYSMHRNDQFIKLLCVINCGPIIIGILIWLYLEYIMEQKYYHK